MTTTTTTITIIIVRCRWTIRTTRGPWSTKTTRARKTRRHVPTATATTIISERGRKMLLRGRNALLEEHFWEVVNTLRWIEKIFVRRDNSFWDRKIFLRGRKTSFEKQQGCGIGKYVFETHFWTGRRTLWRTRNEKQSLCLSLPLFVSPSLPWSESLANTT